MLNRDRAELWEYYKKNDDVARYGGLRPSRIRPVRCSSADRHNIARGAYPGNGPGENLTCAIQRTETWSYRTLGALTLTEG